MYFDLKKKNLIFKKKIFFVLTKIDQFSKNLKNIQN